MKRIASFIVHHCKLVLCLMLALTAVCAALSPSVQVNTDMTEYLPASSPMKQGLDLMDEEFPDAEETSTIRVMVQGLTAQEKQELLGTLEALEHVDSVEHDAGEDYNKGDQALFVVHTPCDYGSPEEAALEEQIATVLGDRTAVVKNDDSTSESIPAVALAAALGILLAVLFTMCGSWVEPLLFLVAIGFAVVINAGTNLLLGSVSYVTNMIAALLQLVLSMDYSIILMNRYRQELARTRDRREAMASALASSFRSIASSSLTTFVGLLSLACMAFRIGADLGIVLAKGVLISMVCVLTVLPGLILLCGGAIEKTAKRVPCIPMGGLGRFSYRFRWVLTGLFAVLLGLGIAFQSSTPTAFTLESNDPIAEVFPTKNQVVMLYSNEDEDAAAQLAQELEDDPLVTSAACYPSTLGKGYTAAELPDALDDLAAESDDLDFELDPELLGILYYSYYCPDAEVKMTASEFLHFVDEEVAGNPLMADQLDAGMLDDIDRMMAFADRDKLLEKKSVAQLAQALEMEKDDVEQLLVLYYSTHAGADPGTMTLQAFTALISELADDPAYAVLAGRDMAAQVEQLSTFTDAKAMTTPCSAAKMAALLGMETESVQQVYGYYFSAQGNNDPGTWALSPQDMLGFLLDNQETFGAALGSKAAELALAKCIVDGAVEGTAYKPAGIAQLFGMETAQVRQLFLLNQARRGNTAGWGISLDAFTRFLIDDVLADKDYASQLDGDAASQLENARTLMDAVISGKSYGAAGLTKLFSGMGGELSRNDMELMCLYYGSVEDGDPSWTMSIHQLFDFLSGTVLDDPLFAEVIDQETRDAVLSNRDSIEEGIEQLKGPRYSRLVLTTLYPAESGETEAFIQGIKERCASLLSGDWYLIGTSPMNSEMEEGFADEMNLVTAVTVLAIFLVVALSFRSLAIPLLLVLLIQCGVRLTVSLIGLQGYSIYYLALLIVQSILMGATIDYAILYTNYYLESRRKLPAREALGAAYAGSINTVLTSGLILILVTGIVGKLFENPTVAQICSTISMGSAVACALIVFLLPGMLAAFDKLVTWRKGAVTAPVDCEKGEQPEPTGQG